MRKIEFLPLILSITRHKLTQLFNNAKKIAVSLNSITLRLKNIYEGNTVEVLGVVSTLGLINFISSAAETGFTPLSEWASTLTTDPGCNPSA